MEQPTSKYSNQRVAGKEHIPIYPKGFVAVRIIQLILAIIILGLSAYGIVYLIFAGDALTLFTAIATIITSIYCLVAHFGPPKAYNYWAILGLDIFLVLFWLISFAILASQVASAFAVYHDYANFYGDYYDDYETAINIYGGCLAGAAGLGGVEFLLYVISLSIHGVMLHRHRTAGLKCMPVGSVGSAVGGAPGPDHVEKYQMQPQSTQVYPQQQQPGPMAGPPQQPQQAYYPPQQSPSPLSAQPTGEGYAHPHSQPQMTNPGQPIYEAPINTQQHHQ
ncbi:hypothetical protein GGR54DRAFT_102670 [Hypoxylon sp. NC1633]|nr:hypothetical protein GGR54DRAFT_102670 [Hypoxylon sp. NC1633]